jgi:hypothetical protein
MNLREIGIDGAKWIRLAQNGDQFIIYTLLQILLGREVIEDEVVGHIARMGR